MTRCCQIMSQSVMQWESRTQVHKSVTLVPSSFLVRLYTRGILQGQGKGRPMGLATLLSGSVVARRP
jgi:hypothetical protein